MKYCWAECCAMFFIVAGGISVLFLAWIMVGEFLRTAGMTEPGERVINLSNGFMLSAAIALTVILWMMLTPFGYGIKWYRIQQVNGNTVHLRSIFSCYTSIKRFLQVMNLNIMLIMRKMCVLLPIAAVELTAVVIVHKIGIAQCGRNDGNAAYNLAFVLLLLLTAVLFCIYEALCIKYAAAPYIYVNSTETPPAEIIEKSKRLMECSRGYLFDVMRSFIAEIAVCLLIFPIVFIIPHMQMVYTAAIAEIIDSDSGEAGKNVNYEEQLASN